MRSYTMTSLFMLLNRQRIQFHEHNRKSLERLFRGNSQSWTPSTLLPGRVSSQHARYCISEQETHQEMRQRTWTFITTTSYTQYKIQ